MARQKNVRSIILSDEVFIGLKTAATIQNMSVSKLMEKLAREYLTTHADEIHTALQRQISLFETYSDSLKSET